MKDLPNIFRCHKRWLGALLLSSGAIIAGCNFQHSGRKPSVQITHVPIANRGGPENLDLIEGRTSNVKPGQQIVLYAYSGGNWWIQPLAGQPFTKVQPDATWRNSTHLGTEYAALLVDSGYWPQPKTATLPERETGVVAVAVASGAPPPPTLTKVLHFSGYDWTVRAIGSDRGGEKNDYDPANAWVDGQGYLHLRMYRNGSNWSCAEVSLNRSLGYGSYRFVIQDSAHLEPSAVLGMFTWDDARSGNFHNEFDIELSQWGNPKRLNGQFVVQPIYVPENVSRFQVPSGVMTHSVRWEPERLEFKTIPGTGDVTKMKAINDHVFTSGIPSSAGEQVHFVLYEFLPSKSPSRVPSEVVVQKFEYFP